MTSPCVFCTYPVLEPEPLQPYKNQRFSGCDCVAHKNCWNQHTDIFKVHIAGKNCPRHCCRICEKQIQEEDDGDSELTVTSICDHECRVHTICKTKKGKAVCQKHQCALCQKDVDTMTTSVRRLSCGHAYCVACALSQFLPLGTQCPECLYFLDPKEYQYFGIPSLISKINPWGFSRASVFTKAVIMEREPKDLVCMRVTIEDMLVAGITSAEIFDMKLIIYFFARLSPTADQMDRLFNSFVLKVPKVEDRLGLLFEQCKMEPIDLLQCLSAEKVQSLGFAFKEFIQNKKMDLMRFRVAPVTLDEWVTRFGMTKKHITEEFVLLPPDYALLFNRRSSGWSPQRLVELLSFSPEDLIRYVGYRPPRKVEEVEVVVVVPEPVPAPLPPVVKIAPAPLTAPAPVVKPVAVAPVVAKPAAQPPSMVSNFSSFRFYKIPDEPKKAEEIPLLEEEEDNEPIQLPPVPPKQQFMKPLKPRRVIL